jgi:Zinc-binding dehydrogenase
MGLLGRGGRLVMFGWSAGEPTQISTKDLIGRSLTATWALGQNRAWERQRELEAKALEEFASGRLVPLTQHFALADAAAAHAALETRATVGKTVLVRERTGRRDLDSRDARRPQADRPRLLCRLRRRGPQLLRGAPQR